VRKICRAQCSGPIATVTVYRDASGRVGALENGGDIRSCSHPPTVFYDAKGKQIGVIPLRPVKPGSAAAKRFQAIRTKATAGLSKAESFLCRKVR
jgi:hypothetical protein